MNKMTSLFVREGKPYLARDEYMPDTEWVQDGEGVATRKWDGTCCAIWEGVLHCRRHKKFIPVAQNDPNCKWHNEWLKAHDPSDLEPGTYELVGPGIQGNPEGYEKVVLVKHGLEVYPDCPRTYDGLLAWLRDKDIEGIVWHRYPGETWSASNMVKIKKCDFGLPRKP